jgi:hypothetical protein
VESLPSKKKDAKKKKKKKKWEARIEKKNR